MLEFLRGKASERKLRLFAVACCRRVEHLIPVAVVQQAIQVAERYADKTATEEERIAAWSIAYTLAEKEKLEGLDDWWEASDEAAGLAIAATVGAIGFASTEVVAENANAAVSVDAGWLPAGRSSWVDEGFRPCTDEEIAQVILIRDIFGNPFRPITLDPAWLTWHDGLLVSMARQMYESRDFTDMPILADALEEAGCSAPDLLCHCRLGGEHVRGCWMIDLVLGKS
jgi:hypothetical protein